MQVHLQPVRRIVLKIEKMLGEYPEKWEEFLEPARSAVATLETLEYFQAGGRLSEQIYIIQVLQKFAYHDADNGSIRDLALWCQSSWLRLLVDHPENIDVLAGLGSSWLQKSQSNLALIQEHEAASSSNSGSLSSAVLPSDSQFERVQGPLYVEARGDLQPAVDFFTRAAASAEMNGILNGDLLVRTAEAYMSLGNVSPTAAGELLFRRAIEYLRRAEAIPGYTLSAHHQQYLEDFGRYVPL